MTQYVIQIQTDTARGMPVGWLATCFNVTAEDPIPTPELIPPECIQIILTNTASYDAIVAVYDQYTTSAIYSYDEPGAKIDCTGAVTDSWPIA